MRITESQLRRIIRQEVRSLIENKTGGYYERLGQPLSDKELAEIAAEEAAAKAEAARYAAERHLHDAGDRVIDVYNDTYDLSETNKKIDEELKKLSPEDSRRFAEILDNLAYNGTFGEENAFDKYSFELGSRY